MTPDKDLGRLLLERGISGHMLSIAAMAECEDYYYSNVRPVPVFELAIACTCGSTMFLSETVMN